MDKINILLADDHNMIIEGLTAMLEPEEDINIVGVAHNGNEVFEKVSALSELDLVVMDINMPELDGIETTLILKERYPEINVLILTMYNRQEFVKNLLDSGIDGYIMKNSGKKVLLEAVRSLHQGEPFYGPEITKTIMKGYQKNRIYSIDVYNELSEREKDVMRLIVGELTSVEIADRLFISTHTVDSHRKNILSKLDVKNVAGLVKFALQMGIVKDFDL